MLLLLTLPSSLALQVSRPLAPVRSAATTASRSPGSAMMSERWSDKVLDESLPDPVFDRESGYKGRVPYGFSNAAEKWNGRAAMMGFSICYLQELFTGKGVLSLYGLPYDEGAIVSAAGSNVFEAGLGLIGAVIGVTALSYAGEKLNNEVLDKDYDGKKLPKLPFL